MGGPGYHALHENRVFLEFLTIKFFSSKLTSGGKASWKVTAEAGRREEQVLEGTLGRVSTESVSVSPVGFLGCSLPLPPHGRVDSLFQDLEPMLRINKHSSFLKSYTWGRSESSLAVHCDLGDGSVSKVMPVKHEDLRSDFRHTQKKSGVAAGACSPSTEDPERKIPGTHWPTA